MAEIGQDLIGKAICRYCKFEYYSPMTNCYLQEDNLTICENKNNYCLGIDGIFGRKIVNYNDTCEYFELYKI